MLFSQDIYPKRLFLYIDPLKQGLKLPASSVKVLLIAGFLYIDPLKQGLKLS